MVRVVSLVPSLTETLCALGLSEQEIVGRTPWCIHPAERVAEIRVVGGTKTPRVHKIVDAQPQLVVLDEEENRRETYDALCAAGIRCWAARVRGVADVPPMLEELGAEVGRAAAGRELAAAVRDSLREAGEEGAWRRGPRALPLIWHEPLMALAPSRYGGDLLRAAGWQVPDVPGDETGYPRVTPQLLGELGIEELLLTSEPHDFSEAEGHEIAQAVAEAGYPAPRPLKVDGEALTWFGARTAEALVYFRKLRPPP